VKPRGEVVGCRIDSIWDGLRCFPTLVAVMLRQGWGTQFDPLWAEKLEDCWQLITNS